MCVTAEYSTDDYFIFIFVCFAFCPYFVVRWFFWKCLSLIKKKIFFIYELSTFSFRRLPLSYFFFRHVHFRSFYYFHFPIFSSTFSTKPSVTSADFDNDAKLDLAVANSGDNTVSVLLGNGNGTFQTPSKYGARNGPFCAISGDLKNDNKQDLIVTNRDSGDLSAFLNVCR